MLLTSKKRFIVDAIGLILLLSGTIIGESPWKNILVISAMICLIITDQYNRTNKVDTPIPWNFFTGLWIVNTIYHLIILYPFVKSCF